MDLDRLTAALLYGVGFGVFCGVIGALFGAMARAFAYHRGRALESTFMGALLSGALRGGLFSATLGGFLGAWAGIFNMLEVVVGAALLLPFLAALAVAFGLLAYFLEWLGTSGKANLPPEYEDRRPDLSVIQDPSRGSDAIHKPPDSLRSGETGGKGCA